MNALARNIKRLRNQLEITQPELADEFKNLSRSAVALWEVGKSKPSLDNLLVLCKVFGVTLDELVFDSNAMTLNHQKETIKQDLIAAWSYIEKTQKMTQQFNAWGIPEKVEFLLTIDAVLSSDKETDQTERALLRMLEGNQYEDKKTKPRKKTVAKIVGGTAHRKRKKKT